jgi:hypothetical protein
MQILHLKDSLLTFNAIGPFESLQEKLLDAESRINELIAQNRVKNLEVKKTLLENAREQMQNEDIRDAIRQMKEIRFNWMTVGSIDPEQAPNLESDFQTLMEQFNIIRDQYNEERRIEIDIRYQKLQIILETAKSLNTYPPEVEQSYFKFRKLEDEWRAVGNIPKEMFNPLQMEFKRIKKTIAKFARKGPPSRGPKPIYIPKFIPPQEQPLYDNLKYRMALIEEGQGLLKMDLRMANEYAKELQSRWKTAGQIPDKYKSEIFAQFNNISDRIFESSYLARVVNTKYPHFRTMAPMEQLEAKMETMDEIIMKEDMTVKMTQAEFQFMSPEERNTEENRAKFARMNTSLRKLKMKTKIHSELRRELDRMRNPGASSSYGQYPRRERTDEPGERSGRSYSSGRPDYGNRPDYQRDRTDYHRDRPAEGNYERPAYDEGNRYGQSGGNRFNPSDRYGNSSGRTYSGGNPYNSGERYSPNFRPSEGMRDRTENKPDTDQ